MENLYKTHFCDSKGYLPYNNFLKVCDLSNFKSFDDLTYMTEHTGETQKNMVYIFIMKF